MITVTQSFNGVTSTATIDNKEVEADKKQVLDIIEKAITVVEIKELRDTPSRAWDKLTKEDGE